MKLKVKFTPVGWLLAGVAGLVVAAFVVLLVLNMVNATRISASRISDDSYVWEGGTLVLENTEKDRAASCTIKPDEGTDKLVSVERKRTTGLTKVTRYKEYEPWFDGSATITCTGGGGVNAWSGSAVGIHNTIESGPLRLLGIVLVVIPLGSALVFFRADRKKRTEH